MIDPHQTTDRYTAYFDVVCPYCRIEEASVEYLAKRHGVHVDWLPYELRPAPEPLLEPRGQHLRVDWPRNVYRLALASGVEMHLPPHQPRSTIPLAAYVGLIGTPFEEPFRRALFEVFFGHGLDVSTEPALHRTAALAGISADVVLEAAYEPENIQRLRQIRANANAAGVRGVPTITTPDGSKYWGAGAMAEALGSSSTTPASS